MPLKRINERLNELAGTTARSNQDCINILAGTTGLLQQDAFNIWASTSLLSRQGAANAKAGTTALSLQEALEIAEAGGGFTDPSDISGLQYWFDILDSPAWSDDGTTPAVDNSDLYRWDDISGNGRNLVQANASLRPKYAASGGIGIDVTFDGVDEYMATAGFTLNQPFTVVLGCFIGTQSANSTLFDGNTLLSAAVYETANANEVSMTAGSGGALVQNVLPSDYNIITCAFDAENSYINIYQNGGNVVTDSVGTPGTSAAGGFTLGATAPGFFPANISVEFALGYNSVLTAQQVIDIQNWAVSKFSIT